MQDQPRPPLANGSDRCADSSIADVLRAEGSSNRGLSSLMEAHDAVSGVVAKRAGFNGIRASAPSPTLSFGYQGAKDALWNQSVDAVERVVDSIERRALVARLQLPASQPCTSGGIHSRIKVTLLASLWLGSGMPPPISIKSPALPTVNACRAGRPAPRGRSHRSNITA